MVRKLVAEDKSFRWFFKYTCFLAFLIPVIIVYLISSTLYAKHIAKVDAFETTISGEVIKLTDGLFNNKYRIYISVPYVYNGKEYNTDRWYLVEKDDWYCYSVGDSFNESDVRILDKED